jgi:hypothetical protein
MELPDLAENNDYLLPPAITLTAFSMQTLFTISDTYGETQITYLFWGALLFPHLYPEGRYEMSIRPEIRPEEYDMDAIVRANPLPRPLPFITDSRGVIIPNEVMEKIGNGDKKISDNRIMQAIVEAIRQTTRLTVNDIGQYYITPPTYEDVMNQIPEDIAASRGSVA